ncbi:hypothetical protein CANCADRAFT_445 [Tortispora caseinolytica NRRL Y-17796]|uniref:FYVE-type domain-containing protein n=1 Tax=Tortispora caseinolytica NRRL Y-17796 TaxID=767744 RepID=A0A1E4TJD9_9ASCO|nr:hypothetical protein CANCADRAFT_445 [Tortispora caseinolytica NRRL Y-17796]
MDRPKPRRVLGTAEKPYEDTLTANSHLMGAVSPSSESLLSSETSTINETERFVCPICNEEMVSLAQLNRHLDDAHTDVPTSAKPSWLKKSVAKARQLPTVAALNRLSRLDLFDESPASSTDDTRTPSPAPEVTRAHWKLPSDNEKCSQPSCRKKLSIRTPFGNCACCGNLYCTNHLKFRMRLAQDATHDPQNGIWSTVCEICYTSRPGYMDSTGAQKSLTSAFSKLRATAIASKRLEANRLENRLTRYVENMSLLPSKPPFYARLTYSNKVHEIEQSVVPWEKDQDIAVCRYCSRNFSISLRKHHCRLCGQVVCSDSATNCSIDIDIQIVPEAATEKNDPKTVSVRMCKRCRMILNSRVSSRKSSTSDSPFLRAYMVLTQFQVGIKDTLPRFEALLEALSDESAPPNKEQLHEAKKIRQKLLDSFTQYDIAAKRILNFPTQSETQKKLQKSIYAQSVSFLQTHMLPLQNLPKNFSSQRASSTASPEPGLSEEQVVSLRQKLIVLEEQKFMVKEMINNARKSRQFDAIAALEQNGAELDNEISKLQLQLGNSVSA